MSHEERDSESILPAFDGVSERAEWWEDSMGADNIARARDAVRSLVVVGGIVVVQGMTSACVTSQTVAPANADVMTELALLDTPPLPPGTLRRPSLALQRQYGWNFGTSSHELPSYGAFDPGGAELFDGLSSRLAPYRGALKPYYVPTLFDSLALTGTPDDWERMRLREAIHPVGGRDEWFLWGQMFSNLVLPKGVAVVVDLPGLDSVAYAAGIVTSQGPSTYDPVFIFDNWPHPFGVVPAHVTLEAALHYTRAFESRRRAPDATPVFVLDRNRLNPYNNASGQFDNRYVARLPAAEVLRALGVETVVYVSSYGQGESDDLNEAFVSYDTAGIAFVRVVPFAADGVTAWKPERRPTLFDASMVALAENDVGTMPVFVNSDGTAVLVVNIGGSFGRGGFYGGG